MTDYGPNWWDGNDPRNKWTIRGGAVRLDDGIVNPDGTFQSGGPYIHVNDVHTVVGLTAVSVNPDGDLRLHSDEATLGFILVTGDETTPGKGLILGPSGGVDYANVRFYRIMTNGVMKRMLLNVQADWDYVSTSMHNLWVGWFSPYRDPAP